MTLEVETKHGLRTGYCSLNQGLAFSVPILSIDTNHILHCGLQAFNSHFCFICRGRRGNCRSVKPPKSVPRERNEKQMLPIIGKHLFLWGKSESISSCGNLSIGNRSWIYWGWGDNFISVLSSPGCDTQHHSKLDAYSTSQHLGGVDKRIRNWGSTVAT